VTPGGCPVERLEDRRARQAVGAIEVAGDVPAHVPQDAAEVEDDGAEANTGGRWSRRRRPRHPEASGRAEAAPAPCPPTAAATRARAGTRRRSCRSSR